MSLIRRHPAEALACFIWLAYAVLESWIASGATPMIMVWALHGLILMLVMKTILLRAARAPRLASIAVFILSPIAFAVLQTTVDLFATQWVGRHLMGQMPEAGVSPVGVNFTIVFKLNMRVYLWIFGFYAATLALLGAMREAYDAQLQKDRAELDALRLQINPHFLFNALNSVSSLIRQGDMPRAEAMAMELARFYRGNLTNESVDIVSLGEEIEAIEAYLDFEGLRFETLAVTIDCPEALWDAEVPSLIIQPLVENAIKFGGGSRGGAAPVTVAVRALETMLEIRIENDVSDAGPKHGTGTGLTNVRSRLRSHFGDRAALVTTSTGDRWRVVLTMPLSLDRKSSGRRLQPVL